MQVNYFGILFKLHTDFTVDDPTCCWTQNLTDVSIFILKFILCNRHRLHRPVTQFVHGRLHLGGNLVPVLLKGRFDLVAAVLDVDEHLEQVVDVHADLLARFLHPRVELARDGLLLERAVHLRVERDGDIVVVVHHPLVLRLVHDCFVVGPFDEHFRPADLAAAHFELVLRVLVRVQFDFLQPVRRERSERCLDILHLLE